MLPHLGHPALAVDLPPKIIRRAKTRFAQPPELTRLTAGDFAESVLADADAAGFDRFVLIRHSMAGITLPEGARRAPARVAHLGVVSCPVPRGGEAVLD